MRAKRGFALLEMLVCLMIMCCMMMWTLPFFKLPDFEKETFVLDALVLQSEAMKEKTEKEAWLHNIEIRYSATGTVSQAQTIVFDRNAVTMHLGWGRLEAK